MRLAHIVTQKKFVEVRSKVCQLADLMSAIPNLDYAAIEGLIKENLGTSDDPLKVLYRSEDFYLEQILAGTISKAFQEDYDMLKRQRDIVALRVIQEKALIEDGIPDNFDFCADEVIRNLTSTDSEDMLF